MNPSYFLYPYDFKFQQKNEWDCGLAALRTVLHYYSINISEKYMVKIIKKFGLKIFDWGIYIPYLSLIISEIGLFSTIRINLAQYFNNTKRKSFKKSIKAKLRRISKKEDIFYFYKSLLFCLLNNVNIKVYKRKNFPNINHIKKAISSGIPIIVLVSAKEYYGIEEDWNHMLTLLPRDKSEKFIVFDPYMNRGYKNYLDWDNYLKHSFKFNWNKWTGDMIEIIRA